MEQKRSSLSSQISKHQGSKIRSAVIIAAGLGSRMKELCIERPKCLLEVQGKTILQYQLDAFKANHLSQISIVTGHKGELIQVGGATTYVNTNYNNNNILKSLLYAREALAQGFIASYSDIVFDDTVVSDLLESDADIAVAIDRNWKTKYQNRSQHPISEAEKVILGDDDKVIEIGKRLNLFPEKDAHAEFIGMTKCSPRGAEIFLEYFDRAADEHHGKPFINASSFEKAYLTDFLQYLINNNQVIQAVPIEGAWDEIDTTEDLERASKLFESNSISLIR